MQDLGSAAVRMYTCQAMQGIHCAESVDPSRPKKLAGSSKRGSGCAEAVWQDVLMLCCQAWLHDCHSVLNLSSRCHVTWLLHVAAATQS